MIKTINDEQLFQEEQLALQTAQMIATDEKRQNNELLKDFRRLTGQYEKLLRLTRKIFRISDNQGKVLHQHQTEMQTLLDNANQGFLTFGPDLLVGRQFSAECSRIFQRTIAGTSILDLIAPLGSDMREHWQCLLSEVFALPGDQAVPALKNIPPVVRIGELDVRIECKFIFQSTQDGEQPLLMMMFTDITDILKAEEEIHYLSYHDKLTGLYNRAYVEKTVQALIGSKTAPFSVIVADMNGLKITNDMFGHEQGDRLLVAMARVLAAACRQTDIVARWGGDEFLILLPATDTRQCRLVCERILTALSAAESEPIRLSAAIGAATGEGLTLRLSDLFSQAENRMYCNKMETSQKVRANIIAEVENQLQKSGVEPTGHSRRARILAAEFAEFLTNDPELTEKFLDYVGRNSSEINRK